MLHTCSFSDARTECISCVSWVTSADWIVVINRACGMDATDSRTRISTFLLYTGQIRGTLLVDGTFWFTFNVWVAL